MPAFRRVALLQAHAAIPVWPEYYVPDLVEVCSLAAAIRDDVEAVDMPVHPNGRDPLAAFDRYLKRYRPDLVGISTFTGGVPSALRYAEAAARSGAAVVVGGYHPSARPDDMLASPFIEWAVRGEGEFALQGLVRTGSPEGVAGVSFRRNGEAIHNPLPPPVHDLNVLPIPWRDIRPERAGRRGLDYHTDTIYGSRGCRARCIFCANHLVGGPWRDRRIDSILDELSGLPPGRGRRLKRIKFWDSTFLSDAGRVEQLCRGIIDRGLHRRFRFIAESRVEDIVRAAAIIPLMKEAGFARFGSGIESPHRRTHAFLKKGLNPSFVERAAAILRTADIQFTKFYIVGHDGEDEETVRAYPDEALRIGFNKQHAAFFIMTPYPGTELENRYEKRGFIVNRDWALYMNLGAVVAPDGIQPRRLQILHAGVVARHKIFRRFLDGNPGGACLGGVWEPLFLLAMVERLRDPARTRRGIAEDLHAALVSASGEITRPSQPSRRAAILRRFAMRFHLSGRPSILIGDCDDGTTVTLGIRPDGARLPGRIELHLDLERVAAIVDRTDARRIMSDAMTLRWNPLALRAAWVPGLVTEVGKALAGLGGLAAFHGWTALTRRQPSHAGAASGARRTA